MIQLFINGLAASAGGGLTYLRNIIPELERRPTVKTTILLNPGLRGILENFKTFRSSKPCIFPVRSAASSTSR